MRRRLALSVVWRASVPTVRAVARSSGAHDWRSQTREASALSSVPRPFKYSTRRIAARCACAGWRAPSAASARTITLSQPDRGGASGRAGGGGGGGAAVAAVQKVGQPSRVMVRLVMIVRAVMTKRAESFCRTTIVPGAGAGRARGGGR